jgi:hypothetical protein
MDYTISPEQLDKIIKPFFDKEFKHAKWGEHDDSYGGGTWYGFLNQDDIMLVGHPSHDSHTYFTNGQHFSDMWQFFSIDGKEFNDAMGRYIKKKYGSDFNRIM